MSEFPLDGGQIRGYLGELAAEFAGPGPQHELVLVGGSLLAWHGLRPGTHDVDTVRRLDEELRAAIAAVAGRHGLAPRWLNDSAAAFAPATLQREKCDLLMDHPRLRILGAPMDQVFLMKLYAARARDHDDMIAIWPLTGFDSPGQACEQFWLAYPHAPDDPHLAEYVTAIADALP